MKRSQLAAAVAVPLVMALAAGIGGGSRAQAEDLVAYQIVDGAIPKSLTGKPGDPAAGEATAVNRKLGNCLACHSLPIKNQPFPGDLGPDLASVGSSLSEGQLRLRLVDSKKINPDTAMPSFYKVEGLHRVAKAFEGKPILTAQQVEDVVAYLMTLKGN
ncbi:sulfur-oxidizing protein SoxX [Tistlia consotensis]|uniref:Sulfur-oxidizing protein SoxX n=1 Tax=Tistlia consotensis USBA 355 TaxID=560819 RepID=A0A1Y6B7H2_9PROT|nr:sulfur oxidation c-type cytochrome SoxX [Tistlia consotensis]SME89152.1 sulfur-oxidizing protein SoxX [Tistlia consotensis USBA 355]SNR25716.1 sulfur-oxidizing protein SoxX [Tistlia consotensis]